MSIWKVEPNIDLINQSCEACMVGHIGIKITEAGDDYLKGTMPVDHRTTQPFGILHGGASVTLAESLGSLAANLAVDPATHRCVGLDINANHVRAVPSGSMVTGIAKPYHIGRSTQVWDIKIYDEREKLVCVSRLTMSVISN